MALRYWVGGTAAWDATAGTKWALTDGGGGGQAVPTSSDDVFFTAASGANAVTTSGGLQNCKNLTLTGFTGSFTGNSGPNCFGQTITLDPGMTWSATGNLNLAYNGAGTITVNTNSATISGTIVHSGTNSTVSMNGDITCANFTISGGTLNTNNYAINCTNFSSTGTSTRTLNLGSSVITCRGTSGTPANFTNTGITLNATGSTFKFTGAGAGSKTFAGADLTYGLLWFSGSGTGSFIITGTNTFNDLKDDGTGTHSIVFPNVTTTVNSTFNVNGTSGHLISLIRTGGSGTFTLSSNIGTISCNYIQPSNSVATGGSTWNAYTSNGCVDGGGNTGWNFSAGGVNTTSFFHFI